MRKKSIITLSVIVSFSLNLAFGEEADTVPESLEEVVVTATRTPKALKDVPVVTRVISSAEIKKSDPTDIKDLLTDELPGLEFSYAMSQETSLNMGGFGGSSILFLVDGERLAGETMDNIDYSRLNLENVGKVEIVKGAASALYGANAVGGVVNLISKENTAPWHINFNSRYGTVGNERRFGGDANFNSARWNSNTSAQYSAVNTIRLTDPFDTYSKIHNVYGGTTVNVKERLIFRISDDSRLTARGGYFYRTNNRETYTDAYRDYSAGLKFNSAGLELSYAFDQYGKQRLISGVNTHTHDYTNRQHIAHALYSRHFGGVNATFGADWMYDYLSSYQFAGDSKHYQQSADGFAQVDFSPLSWLNVVSSLRYDYFSASRCNSLTARVATMFKLPPATLRFSYSGGFRAPTLKEMYMDFDMAGISMIYGNPELKPERSHNFSVSAERAGRVGNGAFSLSVVGNFNDYHNRIAVTEIDLEGANPDGAHYYNERRVKSFGCDIVTRYRSDCGPGASLSLNFLSVRGKSVDSQFAPPRPFSATWKLFYDRRFSRNYSLYAALSGRYLGKPDSSYPVAGAYSLVKLTVQQGLWRGINLNLAVDNLFNYRPKIYYWNSPPTRGASFSVGISLNINELYEN